MLFRTPNRSPYRLRKSPAIRSNSPATLRHFSTRTGSKTGRRAPAISASAGRGSRRYFVESEPVESGRGKDLRRCRERSSLAIGQALLGLLEYLRRQLRVGHDPRHGQRADHRRYRDQGTPPGGSGRELAELPGHDLDELQEAGRRRCPGFLVASGKFAADCGQRASSGRIVSVIGREVSSRRPRAFRRGSPQSFEDRRFHGLGTGLGDELVLRLEVLVEPAVGQAGGTHQVVEAGRDDPMLAELSAGRRDDPFAGLRRFLSRLPHDVDVAPGQKSFGFQLTSKIASLTIWMSI